MQSCGVHTDSASLNQTQRVIAQQLQMCLMSTHPLFQLSFNQGISFGLEVFTNTKPTHKEELGSVFCLGVLKGKCVFFKTTFQLVDFTISPSAYEPSSLRLPHYPCVVLPVQCVPSDRAKVSFTRLLMPSSSDVVAVSTVPPSVSRSSFSSCV